MAPRKKSIVENLSDDPDESELPATKRSKRTDAQLEELYDQTSARILQEKGDFLLPQIVGLVSDDKWINLRPEYQRRIRWDDKRRSLLIESVLMNIPIPPVFLFERELGRYEVMDGQQRLSSIVDFYKNKLKLTGLQFWPDLNGRTYNECPTKIRRGLDRRRISSVVLLAESKGAIGVRQGDIRLQVFGRLNTGGVSLNPQELRNCVFTGKFNDLIVRLAQKPLFNKMWDMPIYSRNLDAAGYPNAKLRANKFFQTMGDCQVVLRFFAFRDTKQIAGSVRRMLDSCMERNQNLDKEVLKDWEKQFEQRLSTVHEILGVDAFKLPIDGGNHSRPLFDAVMVAVDELWDDRTKLLKAKTRMRKDFPNLFKNKKTYNLIVGKPNTANAVKARIKAVKKFFADHI